MYINYSLLLFFLISISAIHTMEDEYVNDKQASPIFLIAPSPIKEMTTSPLLETQETNNTMQDLILPSPLCPTSKNSVVKIVITTAASHFVFQCPCGFSHNASNKETLDKIRNVHYYPANCTKIKEFSEELQKKDNEYNEIRKKLGEFLRQSNIKQLIKGNLV